MTPASRGALTRTIAKESDGEEQPMPSNPDGVPAGMPTKCGDSEVYGRSDEDVRLGLARLPRVTLSPEFVQRHKSVLSRETRRWPTVCLKDRNLLLVVFYVWPLLEQMIFQTNWRIYAKPYDQDNHDATSVSFLVGKDRAYRRHIWVMAGDNREQLEGTNFFKVTARAPEEPPSATGDQIRLHCGRDLQHMDFLPLQRQELSAEDQRV
ncbi:unnamed protein product [Vitrella brassicaformis CCMP3155]|uniref:Uncharacterized protein n=1 Tax=Vitrella brassicaformis (strain CCMP3155) TaxID=1169540 RepID=A0A0G4GPG1_VITBC|nr:unnamed protein product [Vitrella brassicaformis CCMP3155]|eukprot:CEM32246.1 unnamed protein product [Vitrella brassicaformis CCMP3155]